MNATTDSPYDWSPHQLDTLTGQTFVITGANTGAGFQASRLLLAKLAQVIMLNRSSAKSTAAIAALKQEFGDDAKVSFIRMDFASLDSVRRAAQELLVPAPKITALICNAAIAQVAKHTTTAEGFESQFGVNHLGHFLLCGLLFECIDASRGRIVVVGSNAYKMGLKKIQFDDIDFTNNYSAWNAYAQSKLAQMQFAFELQRRVEAAAKHVQVRVCHPGASRTNLLKDTASRLNKIIWSLLAPLIAQSAQKGAWPEVMCATHHTVKPFTLYGPTKRADMVGPVGECVLHEVALDTAMAAKLWTVSEHKTGFTWPI
ncbi:SDR family oxidoreductase [Salinimonas sediminis]|uniref:SDR family oxidoreductase n=1 Tax=Salinimonas sediminis TaxID=2303538 RepID=A0A346NKT2_9ALTE|nr:SDR family oxidoreductase [Salinimonas sediminis]AXR06139.1 SDR family oxidoreductase [Salinimonas sediminis]